MVRKIRALQLTLLVFLQLVSLAAIAHAPRENYVWINIEEDHIVGRFEVNINDLKDKLEIDVDSAGADRTEGVDATSGEVQDYLLENFSIADSTGELAIQFTSTGVFSEADDFAQYYYRTARLPDSDVLTIKNTIFMTPEFASNDRLHRSLIVLEYNKVADKDFGLDTPFLVFSPKKQVAELNTVNPSGILEWQDFLKQGVLHIWFGYDHVLFIIVLLLSTVLVSNGKRWEPIERFGSAFINTLKIITIFTVAHSITLSLAAFGLVTLNSALVESIIAFSIIAIAINNIFPRFNSHAWILVFAFGLFHGLGFASVMADLQFRTGLMGHILLMFNVGVELGQIAIVAIVFPVLFLLRRQRFYRSGIVVPVSLLAIIIGLYWVVERTGLIEHAA